MQKNEKKIEKLKEQIKVLEEKKPRTDRQILESIENLLEKILYRIPIKPIKSEEEILRESLPFGTILQSDINKKPLNTERIGYALGI